MANEFIQAGDFIFAVDNVSYINLALDDEKYRVKVCFKESPGSEWIKFSQEKWDTRKYVDIMAKPMPPVTDESSLVQPPPVCTDNMHCSFCTNRATHVGIHWSGVPSCCACDDHIDNAVINVFTYKREVITVEEYHARQE